MNFKSDEMNKVRITDVNNKNLLEKNVRIVKDSPSTVVEEVLEEDLYDDSYTDDVVYDYDAELTDSEETKDDDFKESFSDIEAPELLEVVVFEELDSMIKVDYNDLERINLEINVLNEKEEDALLLDEIKQLKAELEQIIKRFEALANKYDFVYGSLDYEKIRQMSSYYIKDLINEYKDALENDDLLDEKFESLKDIEEYIGVINTIIEIENKKDCLQEKIDEKLDRFEIRDEEFEKMKEDYYSIDKINDVVTSFNKSQAQTLNTIKQLVDKSINIEKKTDYKRVLSLNMGNALVGTLLIASTPLIPPTRRGNLFRIGLMVMGISRLNSVVNTHEKEEVTFDYNITNYEKELNDGIVSIRNVIKDIDNAFADISLLRQRIKEEFAEYINDVPEVKELMKNINKVEKELTIQQEIAKSYSNEFSMTLQENNEKIKKLEKYQD